MNKFCLIVEDDPLHVKIVKDVLDQFDFEIKSADNASDAFDICKKKMPDTIILDWMMPEVSGVEFASKLRTIEGGDKPYIIMCTAKDRRSNMSEALAAGADNYIVKPFDPEAMEVKLLEGNLINHKEF